MNEHNKLKNSKASIKAMANNKRKKIYNPKTKRWVYKDTATGRRVNELYYFVNPLTQRRVRVGGRTYKAALNTIIKNKEKFINDTSTQLDQLQQKFEKAQNEIKKEHIKIRRELHKSKYRTKISFNRLIRDNDYQKIINYVIKDGGKLSRTQATQLYNKLINAGKFSITVDTIDGTYNITLSNKTKRWFTKVMMLGLDLLDKEVFGSDQLDAMDIKLITHMKIIHHPWSKKMKKFRDKSGRFFPYINTSNIDLSRYQIYNQEQAYDEDNDIKNIHCLFHTLRLHNIDEGIINGVKLHYVSQNKTYDNLHTIASIKKTDLKKIGSMIHRNINLYFVENSDNNTRKMIMNIDRDYEAIDIALFKGHYFMYEDTEYTPFAIKHYNEVRHMKDFKNIFKCSRKRGKKTYQRSETKKRINSLDMMKMMFKNNMFGKLDLSGFTESVKMNDNIYLGNIENEQREVEYKPKKTRERDIYYADTESFTHSGKNINHELYLLGYVGQNDDIVTRLSVMDKANEGYDMSNEQKMIYRFVDAMTNNGRKNVICYFHNLKYDYHLLEKYLNITSSCEKDNQIYNIVCRYNKCEVEFRDSFKLISFALKKFKDAFNLPADICKKEAIAYDYYTRERHDEYINADVYREYLGKKDKATFDEIIKHHSTYDEETKTFNPTEYYREYLDYDCLTLKYGLEKFNETILKITNNVMNAYDHLTISSLVDKYMMSQGAYDGVYEMTGNLREYVSKAIYGGRVAVNQKYKKKIIEGKISDYDGVSLYPSAINRLCREKGLFCGKAKRFNKDDLKNWNDKQYAIVTIKITAINKMQQIPFIAYKGEGSTEYTNVPKDEQLIIDSITLNDYIKFHDIEYDIYDGVYWDGELNKKMGEVIQTLFNERLKHKKNKNKTMSDTLKLMLNSAYGKTAIKKSNIKKVIKRMTQKEDYLYRNWNTIISYRDINSKLCEFKETKIDVSYNRAHIGCAILSYSKRIMNEVFDVANDNEYPIYYTDTDSLHCNLEDVPKLETKYKERYNKELNGKQLEQFHTDFDLKGAAGEIYATKSIFLGKKSYLDVLESVDKDGNKINGYHIRLKGITEEGILDAAKKYDDSYYGLYADLATGKKLTMVLNPYNEDEESSKVLFEYNINGVRTKRKFERTVSF